MSDINLVIRQFIFLLSSIPQSSSRLDNLIHRISKLTIARGVRPWMWSECLFKLTAIGKTYFKNLQVLHGFSRKVSSKSIFLVDPVLQVYTEISITPDFFRSVRVSPAKYYVCSFIIRIGLSSTKYSSEKGTK